MRRCEKYIWAAALVAMCLCIFSFSADTAVVSGEKSMQIAAFFEYIFRAFLPGGVEYDRETFTFAISHIIRKCAHMAEFCMLAALFVMQVRSITGRAEHFLPLAFTVFYASTDELHQAFVPGRGPAVGDVMIDASGAIIGIIAMHILIKIILGDKKNEIRCCNNRRRPCGNIHSA